MAGITASTKPIRPESVLRSNRPAWWSIRYSTSGLALRDRRLPVGRRRADDLVGVLAVGQPGDADVLELDARRVGLELADQAGQGGHPERARLLARRVDVVGEDDPARVAGQQRDLARRQRGAEAATTLSKPAWWAISASV